MTLISYRKPIQSPYLRYRITTKTIIYFILFYSLFAEFLIDVLGFPAFLRYVSDLANLVLFILVLPRFASSSLRKQKLIFASFLVLIVYCLISSWTNSVSPLLGVLALRNTFRGFVLFFACLIYLKDYDVEKIMHCLFYFQIANCVFSTIQYFFFGFFGDFNGGLLGFGLGKGTFLNTLNVLLLSYYSFSYIKGKEKILSLLLCVGSCLLCAVFSEEKMSLVIFSFLIIFLLFASSGQKKKQGIFALGIVLVLGALILYIIAPDSLQVLTNFGNMEHYLNADYDNWVIPRFQSFSYIYKNMFQHNLGYTLFGFGFGSGNASDISFLQGLIYQKFGQIHYQWFVVQWIFIEMGAVGFILYLGFFVTVILSAFKKWASEKNRLLDSDIIRPAGIFCALFCIVSIWYNATLKTEASYLLFFALSLCLIPCTKLNKTAKITRTSL